MAIFLRGEKVRIRPLETDSQFKYLYDFNNDPESSGSYINFTASSWDGFNSFIHELPKSLDELTFFLIAKNDGDQNIGFVNYLYPRPLIKSTMEIGFEVSPNFRGKGYAFEATKLLLTIYTLTEQLNESRR
jgi:RimJ/RimL family protein N-acetyltransferase